MDNLSFITEKKRIKQQASELEEKPQEDLLQVSAFIKHLNAHINEELELKNNKIYSMLKWLVENFTLDLICELEKDIVFRRARKYEEKNSTSYSFQNLQDLLSVPEDKKDIVQVGRMNQAKEPMYYGVISEKNFNTFDVVLSEVNAIEYDYINILDSKTINPMTSLYIGAFDLLIRGKEMPKWVHSQNQSIFNTLKEECEDNNNDFLFESYTLCNSFLSDILSRKHHGKLYDVTSTLASLLFESEELDSIIYESVQVKGAPVIVIKPNVIDKAVHHESVISYKVLSNLGYGIYRGNEVNKGKVVSGQIKWGNKCQINN